MHCYLYRLGCLLLHHFSLHFFLYFFAPAAPMSPSLPLHCLGVGAPLFYGWVVAWLPSSHPDTQYLWCCLSVWRLGRFSVTMLWVGSTSFLCPSFPISSVLFVRLACGLHSPRCIGSWDVLPCPVRGSCWPCGSSRVCCVPLPAGFYSRWSCSFPPPCHGSSMCLAHQVQVSDSHTAFLVFVTANSSGLASRLLFVVSQRPMISSLAVLVDSLFLVGVVIVSSRRLGLRFPSGRPSTWLLWLLGVHPPHLPFLGASVALLATPLLRVAVHRPLLPFALSSGCGFTLPLPLRPFCLLAHRMAGFEVVSLAWLFFLSSVLGFSYSWSLLVVRLHALGAVTLAVSPVTHSSLTVPMAHWRVSLLFIFVSCLLLSPWSLAILFMVPRPF